MHIVHICICVRRWHFGRAVGIHFSVARYRLIDRVTREEINRCKYVMENAVVYIQ